jgi:3-methyladenine DNA glycosylase/8-oxoguanine DNA glycosylase
MRSWDITAAEAHLRAADPVIGRLIERHGPFALESLGVNPFHALARSIVFQQLSGKAANTIFGRFAALFALPEGATFPAPEAVLAATDEELRSAGLSRQKAAAVRSLAEHFAGGELGADVFEQLADDDVIARLTRVRGIGRWTAEMFLMFQLQRPDVLPVNDVGINRALKTLYGLNALPRPEEVVRIGAAWRPWASVACWYLWRSEDVLV